MRAYRVGAAAASVLPAPVSKGVAVAAAVATSRGSRLTGPLGSVGPAASITSRRDMVARHLRRVYGDGMSRRQLARRVDEAFASYAKYWADSLRIPSRTPDQIRAGMSYDGYDRIQAGLDAGRGIILALPHLGGWEWAGAHLALEHKISVVVERLEPPDLFEWFVDFRERLGMRVIPVGPHAATQCVKALADNHILCLLSDRAVGAAACVDVKFFGETTKIPAGPATLALRTGAPLCPTAVYYVGRDDRHLGFVREPLPATRAGRLRSDVEILTQRLADDFEFLIRRAPTQWHLMQPNWPSDPGWTGPPGADPE